VELFRRRGWLVAATSHLTTVLFASLMMATLYLLILAATYTVLDRSSPHLLGPAAESPLRWALWVAVANALAEGVLLFLGAIPQIRSVAKGYRQGDFLAGKLKITGRHREQPQGLVRAAYFLRSVAVSVMATLLAFVYIGNFALDRSTARIAVISVLALRAAEATGIAVDLLRSRRRREPTFNVPAEFDRQLENLLHRQYPRRAGLTPTEFSRLIEPLKDLLIEPDQPLEQPIRPGRIPFVIVSRQELIPADTAMRLVERRRKTGSSVIDPDELRRFEPIPTVEVPDGLVYLLIDIDVGWETRNLSADEALRQIEGRGRSPLTLEEGIALVTHYPDVVDDTVGFFMPGSRRGGSMLAVLSVSKDRPRLGWWQAGLQSSLLGTPSCRTRRGSAAAVDETPTL
jgi:hypothetical protein